MPKIEFDSKMGMLCKILYTNPMRKLFICTPYKVHSQQFAICLLLGYIYITLRYQVEFSAFLSCVKVTKCVNFQIPRYKGFKVGIFRISPITV